ncbi:MAG: phosphatase PAP2-related protein [Chloroflexota bacterium]
MIGTFVTRLTEARHDIKDPRFIRQIAWVAAFWVVAVVIIILNIEFLTTNYSDAVRPDDLLLDIIPETKAFIVIGDILSALQVLTVFGVFFIWQRSIRRLPHLLFLLGLMYIIRAFVINLTPLAQIQPPSENFPEQHIIAQTFYHGMYFSGHTASAFIQAFFFRGYRHRWLIFVLASGQAFALIASHSHYTIDVVGGFFIAYYVVNVDWLKVLPPSLQTAAWAPWYQPVAVEAVATTDVAANGNGRTPSPAAPPLSPQPQPESQPELPT